MTDFNEIWMIIHIGLNLWARKKSKFKNLRRQKAIILKMKIVIYPFKFPENVE